MKNSIYELDKEKLNVQILENNVKEKVIKRDDAISLARFIAMIFIISCHIMQYYGHELAWWFNVGVQMFLFISGYLYGRRNEIEPLSFYKKSFIKILTDYYIYILIVVCVILFTNKIPLIFTDIFRLFTFSGTIKGLGHLWFISTILFCYLITPLLIKIINEIEKKNNFMYIIEIIFILIVTELTCSLFFNYFNGAWINCYILGLLIYRLKNNKVKIWNITKWIILLLSFVMNIIQIYISYFSDLKFIGAYELLFTKWCNYAHVLLGIVLVMLIIKIFNKINYKPSILTKILKLSDKYSYDIYIVHQFFILGEYSILKFCNSKIIGIVIVVIITILSAVLLNYISKVVKEKLKMV